MVNLVALTRIKNQESLVNEIIIQLSQAILEGDFTYGDLIRVYPFENVFCLLKIQPEDYRFYYSSSGLYKSYYNENSPDPYINSDGFAYIATIDYIAYQETRPKEEIINNGNILCRDIIAQNLINNGYSV